MSGIESNNTISKEDKEFIEMYEKLHSSLTTGHPQITISLPETLIKEIQRTPLSKQNFNEENVDQELINNIFSALSGKTAKYMAKYNKGKVSNINLDLMKSNLIENYSEIQKLYQKAKEDNEGRDIGTLTFIKQNLSQLYILSTNNTGQQR